MAIGAGTQVADVPAMARFRFGLLSCLLFLAVVAAYSNHFHNSFHFDDAHTVTNNLFIRDLRYVPRFFVDGTTFSSLPTNQSWRPLVSTSLALDFRLGRGLSPLWFHASTFFWFLVQLLLMYLLYTSILNAAGARPENRYVGLLAAAWYGLHPAIAETVNYVIQRADLYSTLGVVAGLVIYIGRPKLRKFGIYLLPVVLGAMSKPPAIVFGGILLAYVFLFEEAADWRRLGAALVRVTPALATCAGLAFINLRLTPKSYLPAVMPATSYWCTQPFVVLRYFRSLFFPFWLSADTDLRPFSSWLNGAALAGAAFCLLLLWVAVRIARHRECRPISFGIFWFFLALAPTSLTVLSEVENDHRMFFPFVGLVLSVAAGVALLISRYVLRHREGRERALRLAQVVAGCLLLAFGVGTWQRNRVWHTEEDLWRDVTVKSPTNGRGLMNYGLTLLAKGETQSALDFFQRALRYTPNYYVLEINLGIAYGLLNQESASENHFRRAIALEPSDAQPYFYFGRWLKARARIRECIQAEKIAIARNPAYLEPRHFLLQVYLEQGEWAALRDLAQDTLRLLPQDPLAHDYLARAVSASDEVAAAEKVAAAQPTPDHYLNLSLYYHRAGRFNDCIAAARKALQLRPGYAEAYNNMAAAYESMMQWDLAIRAAREAVRLRPDFTLARNNLAYSLAQAQLASSRQRNSDSESVAGLSLRTAKARQEPTTDRTN
jgi:tetratricopeptide (TPR) repeat protein